METAIIIVLAFMLLISIIILIDIKFDIKGLNIKNQACAAALDKSKKENQILKNKNAAFKNQIHQQHTIYCKENDALKLTIKFRDSKIKELETKYQSSIDKIVERDEKIRDRDSKIIDLEKTKKEYSARVYQLQTQKDMAKHEAIDKANQAVELCNEIANKFKSLNSELETIESQLLEKINP
jgi:chromosome segregation ATPase